MTTHSLLSPAAQADIDLIWDYTAERWGVDQAIAYTRSISAAVRRLTDNPDSGSLQRKLGAPLRKLIAGSHAIYYQHSGERVTIVRVLHVRMDAQLALDR